MSHSTAPIEVKLSFEDSEALVNSMEHAPDSMFYAFAQREKARVLSAAFAQTDADPATAKWDYTSSTRTLNIFRADEVPYVKEFMTCTNCHKYKGCWSDSEVCSDCDEAEDERKMAYNEALEVAYP